MRLEWDGDTVTVVGDDYRFSVGTNTRMLSRAPSAQLSDAAGRRWSTLSLLTSVSTVAARDETLEITRVDVAETDALVTVRITETSSLWRSKVVEFECAPAAVAVRTIVDGSAAIDELLLLGGEATLPGGACGVFRSSIGFSSVFAPVPTEPIAFVRAAGAAVVLGVVGDADAGRLNGIFSPPPLVVGFGRESEADPTRPTGDRWLGAAVRAAVEELTFTTMRYEPLDGGYLFRFAYEGHTVVAGSWSSPWLVLTPCDSAGATVSAHRDDLVAHGFAADARVDGPTWWREPLFCGWGAQCARSAAADRSGDPAASAPSLATAANYDEFLGILDRAELDPGTIVIDDRWQQQYGLATPDRQRWPDLKRWIAGQHARGRRVLLWWKAWDPEGLPVEECVTDAAGRPIAVDPANPAYLARLRVIVTDLLSAGGLDADGFKVDFTQRAPSGRSLRAHDGPWGIAALHTLLETIYEASHAAKPEALVVTHAVHPSFGDVGDMVRLNDVLERDVLGRPVPVTDQLRARHEIVVRSQPRALVDTDQWPMPSKSEWLEYVDAQAAYGVPALYYLESIDSTGERIDSADLERVAASWRDYRERHGLPAR